MIGIAFLVGFLGALLAVVLLTWAWSEDDA